MKKPSTQEFQFVAGNLALDFVNTIGNRLGEQHEYLDTPVHFDRWALRAGLHDKNVPLTVSPQQLRTIRATREILHQVFRLIASGSLPSTRTLAPLNSKLASVARKRVLNCKKGTVEWRWNTSKRDADCFLGPILLSAADLLVAGPYSRIRQCRGEACGWLFLDRSPAKKRSWCSMADCGNRAKVRKFYAKHGRRIN